MLIWPYFLIFSCVGYTSLSFVWDAFIFIFFSVGLWYFKSMHHRQARSFLPFLTLYKLILSFGRALGLISFLQDKISYAY